MPIRSITRPSTGETVSYIEDISQSPGPICEKLLRALKGIQSGKIKDTFGWAYPVYAVYMNKHAKDWQ